MHKLIRNLQLPDLNNKTVFLWGPRKTGKSYFIKNFLSINQGFILIDLLQNEVFAEYSMRPNLLRERFTKLAEGEKRKPIVIDEIQLCPSLLNEVQWLIENCNQHFLLTGSSARKLKRAQANLLGGRAWRREMHPLTSNEIINSEVEFNLHRALTHGLIPSHYLSDFPLEEFRGYLADYLKQEIAEEAQVRNLPNFADFLKIAAITSGQLLNYNNIAREVGVDARTVRNYYEILEDTLLGFRISPYCKTINRKSVETDKFYLFDVGLTNYLCKRSVSQGTPEYGHSFEHFILMELLAYKSYRDPEMQINFWRTYAKQEVDFVINNLEVAIEIKSSKLVNKKDLKNLAILAEEKKIGTRIVICQENIQRIVQDQHGEIIIMPWQDFTKRLWKNGIDKLKEI